MAAFEKYTENSIIYKLRHLTRETPRTPSNIDIDPSRSRLNYSLSPKHGLTANEIKKYYNQRIRDLYHIKRADIKMACQWVVTAPKDLPPEQEKDFFKETYRFLNSLYKEENVLSATIHYDEGVKNADGIIIEGRPHLHYMFIPVVHNSKYMLPNKKGNLTISSKFKEKICANDLINKVHLQNFHSDFQKWLNNCGIRCSVNSGVTGGKNRSVQELKLETREILKLKDKIHELEKENSALKEKAISLEQEHEKISGWGEANWGKDGKEWEKEY